MRKMLKKYQKKLNKEVKALNKNVANDNLWLGRFEMRQKENWFYKFEDNSGGILHAIMRIYDKKTGYYKDYNIDYAPYYRSAGWRLWESMNNFITEDAKIWSEKPSPREKEFVKDYRKIKIPDSVMKKRLNLYLGVEHFYEDEM